MIKIAIRFFLSILVLVLITTVFFRNTIIKYYLERYVKNELKTNCKIDKLNLLFGSFTINGVKISSRNLDASVKEITVKFSPFIFDARHFVKGIKISDLNLRLQNFQISGLELKRSYSDLYFLRISNIWIRDREFTGFLIPIKAKPGQIIFPKAQNPLFGKKGYMNGTIDIKDYEDMSLKFGFSDISFEGIVNALASADAATSGLFDGYFMLDLSKFKILSLTARFNNKGKGVISINKESSLSFLKNYLDGPSYNALIDNFKNYEYNNGIINVQNEAGVIGCNFEFGSEKMGRRSMVINFHDLLGGTK